MDLSGYTLERLREDREFALYRAKPPLGLPPVLVRAASSRGSESSRVARLAHEQSLFEVLDPTWALQPLSLVRDEGRTMLALHDPGGQPLDVILGGKPLDPKRFLHVAIGITSAVRQVHAAGLIHKDIKPANIFVAGVADVRLTGFGFSSRLPRGRQAPSPPESMEGTLEYMAPEQTGRMNRSVDHRSDFYALGITFYEMITGVLPFAASDTVEWIHCHIARQPPPPSVRVEGVPRQLDAIILKLLEKDAEARYRTAAGIEHDLRRCLAALQESPGIEPFATAERDAPERLLISEKLYAREEAIGAFTVAYQRVAAQGKFEIMLVSGRSGVGKSSTVNEMLKSIHSTNGLAAAGKVERYKQDIPYSTLGEAFRPLLRHILSQDDAVLDGWRSAIGTAVGANAQLLKDLFPELTLILREQRTLPSVPEQEAKDRFHEVFRRFLCVFAQPDHPFALFIDDLQWLDSATLAWLNWLVDEGGAPYFMLIVAYRSDEADGLPGLVDLRRNIMRMIGAPTELRLSDLSMHDVNCLIADTLHAEPETVASLAELIFRKTQGNPLFVVQFLTALNTEELLRFDAGDRTWRWDLERIRRMDITANVAELLAEKLARFAESELDVIKQLACLGSNVATETVMQMLGASEEEVDSQFRAFVAADLVHRFERRYAFAHDKVHEAAYALIPEEFRAIAHLNIGRALLASMQREVLEDHVYEIVNQLNRGSHFIDSDVERQQLTELNLQAGKRAKGAAAYESALAYLNAGCAMLPPDCWDRHYRTTFELHFHRAECKFLIGDADYAEEHFANLSRRSVSLSDLGMVVARQLWLYPYLGRADRAVELCVDCLARMGVNLPLNPDSALVESEYLTLIRKIGSRTIGSLVDLPAMQDSTWREVMDLLRGLTAPAGMVNGDLLALLAIRMVNISLDYGHSDESCVAYAHIGGLICGWQIGSFETGREFGELAIKLADERGFDRYAARIYQVVGALIQPYYLPLRECDSMLLRATEVGTERGGFVMAGYGWASQVGQMIDSGTSLGAVLKRAEEGLEFARKRKFALAVEFMVPQRLLIRALRGVTDRLSFDDGEFDATDYERLLDNAPLFLHANVRYRIRRLQLHFYAGEYAQCMALVMKLDGKLSSTPFWESIAEYPFFSALARAAMISGESTYDREAELAKIRASYAYLVAWSVRCPDNFSDRSALVAAEIARLEGRELEAQRLYEEAIRLAQRYGFLQNEGIANELAARFYASRGFEIIADAYWRSARSCYFRWGAKGKIRQLDQQHPRSVEDHSSTVRAALASARDSSLERLDLAAVVEMHQAVSQEIVLDKLIERLMTIAMEYAGAVRGLLLLHREGALGIVAEASTNRQSVAVDVRRQFRLAGKLPQSILNYVVHTQEVAIVADAQESHSTDEYVREARVRAILCIPLVKQSRLVGVMYLENNLSANVFTKDRLLVLQLLASQAAISIENAELFSSAQGAQSASRRVSEELRQSFDTMPALAWRASSTGNLEFSNKQWHDYTGISPTDATSRLWIRAFHPDDVEKVTEKWRHLLEFHTSGEFEARMRRFDGEFRSFLIRVTPMRNERGEVLKWHGTHTDIESLKRAEHAQEALARVTRITAIGELTVSIAHEINQPLMAIVTNAATCLRWLKDGQLNLDEARSTAERIIRDGHRAGDIIASIRAMAKKTPPKPAELDLNALISEVLSLMQNELNRHEISTETSLAEDAATVLGDRIQLQQVLLNLIMNGVEAISAASHEWRTLKIGSQRGESDFVLITIADTGIGLNPADGERIFDVFYTTKQDGMGMGLAICRSIIEAHGGRLWACPNESMGTVFHLTLPTFSVGGVH